MHLVLNAFTCFANYIPGCVSCRTLTIFLCLSMIFTVCGNKEVGHLYAEGAGSSRVPSGWPLLLWCLWNKKLVHPHELEKVCVLFSEVDVNLAVGWNWESVS